MSGRIEDHCQRLNHEIVALTGDLEPHARDKIISSVSENLEHLEKLSLQESGRLTPEHCGEIRQLLLTLDSSLSGSTFESASIEPLKIQARRIEEVVQNAEKLPSEPPPAELSLSFFCTFDTPDENGALGNDLCMAIHNRLPIVTSRSLLCGSGKIEETLVRAKDIEILLDKESEWDIYIQHDASGCRDLVLLLPKCIKPMLFGREKLRALGFADDGTLHEATVLDLKQEGKKPPQMEQFERLFAPHARVGKVISIVGHGSSTYMCGLSLKHYKRFLQLLESIHCRALIATTCAGGGENSHMLADVTGSKACSFLQLYRSIGDFISKANEPAEKHLRVFMTELCRGINAGAVQTIPQLRSLITYCEGGDQKRFYNSMQVRFPYSKGLPGGIRPIEEGGESLALTMHRLESERLLHAKEHRDETSFALVVKQKYLLLYPLVTNLNLRFVDCEPIILSMVPGNALHLIHKISCENSSVIECVRNLFRFCQDSLITAIKGILIGEFSDENHTLKEVVIFLSETTTWMAYWKEGSYFLYDGKKRFGISQVEHALLWDEVTQRIEPSRKSVRAALGDRQSVHELKECCRSRLFWSREPGALLKLLMQPTQIDRNELLSLAKSLSTRDREVLVCNLLKRGRPRIAIEIHKRFHLSADLCNTLNVPLIFIMIKYYPAGVHYLIKSGVDLNVRNPRENKNTPLQVAFKLKSPATAELIMAQEGVNLNRKSGSGRNAIGSCLLNHPKLLLALVDRGANINLQDKDGKTLLCMMVEKGFDKEALALLDAGADPNIGNISPMTLAAHRGTLEIVKRLYKQGGKPFAKDASGRIPFVEAILVGSVAVTGFFMRLLQATHDIKDYLGFTPSIAAVISGDLQKISMLWVVKAPFPKQITMAVSCELKVAFGRLIRAKKFEVICRFIKWNNAASPAFIWELTKALVLDAPNFLCQLAKEKLLDPNLILHTGNTLFQELIIYGHPESIQEEWAEIAILHGIDINQKSSLGTTPLDHALGSSNKEHVRFLLENGAYLSATIDPDKAFQQVAETMDLETIQQAWPTLGKPPTIDLLPIAMHITTEEDVKTFCWLVEVGGDLNQISSDGRTPFCYIISTGNLDLIEFCIEKSAAIHWQEGMDLSPLMHASTMPLVFGRLVSLGADMNQAHPSWIGTPFASFCTHATLHEFRWAQSMGAKINPRGFSHHLTPLQAAANFNPHPAVIFAIISAKADLHRRGDLNYDMPLTAIVKRGSTRLLAWALGKGFDPNGVGKGESPLEAAAKIADPQLKKFKLLIEKGANMNHGGPLALMRIVEKASYELILYCFANGAALTQQGDIQKVFYAALKTGNRAIIELLHQQGYRLASTDIDHTVALEIYQQAGYLSLVLLKELGIDLTQTAWTEVEKMRLWESVLRKNDLNALEHLYEIGYPLEYEGVNFPLKWSLLWGQREFVMWFTEKDLHIDLDSIPDRDYIFMIEYDQLAGLILLEEKGFAPLDKKLRGKKMIHYVVSKRSLRILRHLLDIGAGPTERTHLYAAPLIYSAVMQEWVEGIRLLLNYGASPDLDRVSLVSRKTAREKAHELGNQAIIALFAAFPE